MRSGTWAQKGYRLDLPEKYGSSIVFLILFITSLVGCQPQAAKFKMIDQADFYIVGYKGITGYTIENGLPTSVIQTEVEVVKKNVNPVVLRAELSDRYLVFTDDAWPKGNNMEVISIDFQEGIIHRQKTDHAAYTSAGESDSYYFASTSGGNSFISVYSPNLEEIDYLELKPPLFMGDFILEGNTFFIIGSDIQESTNKNGDSFFPNRLVSGTVENGKLSLAATKELNSDPDRQYWFGDTISRKDYLYSICLGWLELSTHEKIREGSIFRYDLQQETGEFFPLQETAPRDAYEIGSDLLAIVHSPPARFGFTLFNYQNCTNWFVDLEQLGVKLEDNEERIVDIQRLDSNRLLILTDHKLIGYDLSTGHLVFQLPCPSQVGIPFHVWITSEDNPLG